MPALFLLLGELSLQLALTSLVLLLYSLVLLRNFLLLFVIRSTLEGVVVLLLGLALAGSPSRHLRHLGARLWGLRPEVKSKKNPKSEQ